MNTDRGKLDITIEKEAPDQIVLHIDMDCFYAACERLKDPELNGEPVIVGMGYEPGDTIGAVATASYEAREFGVGSAMPIQEALDKLPRRKDVANDPALNKEQTGHYRPVDMEFYKDTGAQVKSILEDYAETIRDVSIDEAYLDVTSHTDWGAVEQYARTLQDEIYDTVGVPASVGVAPNMSAAKIASDYDKPNGCVIVRPGTVREFLSSLPVEEIHGVGPVTAEKLVEEGLKTAGDVASADRDKLEEMFGERGTDLFVRARGEDTRVVEPRGLPKSISNESALETTADIDTKRELLIDLAEQVRQRVIEKGCLFQTIGIKVVEPPFDVNTRATSLPGPIESTELIEQYALDLLDEFESTRVRKLGVRVSGLSFTNANQAQLGDWDSSQQAETDLTTKASPKSRSRGARRTGQSQQTLGDFTDE